MQRGLRRCRMLSAFRHGMDTKQVFQSVMDNRTDLFGIVVFVDCWELAFQILDADWLMPSVRMHPRRPHQPISIEYLKSMDLYYDLTVFSQMFVNQRHLMVDKYPLTTARVCFVDVVSIISKSKGPASSSRCSR